MKNTCFLIFLLFCIGSPASTQNTKPIFFLKTTDTVGLLVVNGGVFKGTKKEITQLHKNGNYFMDPQPQNDSAAVIWTWGSSIQTPTKGLFIKTKIGWERAGFIGPEVVKEISFIRRKGDFFISYFPYYESITGKWFPDDLPMIIQRKRGSWAPYYPEEENEYGEQSEL